MSINISPVLNDTVLCELNDADALQNPGDLKVTPGWTYRGTEVRNKRYCNTSFLSFLGS